MAPEACRELAPLPTTVPSDRHPAAVYLARLAPGSRRTMREALGTMATILAPSIPRERFPWFALRYQHTTAVRTVLAERYAPATANKMLSALRGTLTEAWRLGLMRAEDHARAVDLRPVRGHRLPKGRALREQELRTLFAHAGPRDAALLAVLYGTGLRRAEAAALDLAHVDLHARTIQVQGKGNKERIVHLPPDAAAALAAWLAVRGRDPGPLFLTAAHVSRGQRLSEAGVARVLHYLAARAHVARFSPHDLRRTFVGDLLDQGADLATVQALAGHASPATTARYDRRGERAKAQAACLLKLPLHAPPAGPPGTRPPRSH
jgi:site-specific recombinase XerD